MTTYLIYYFDLSGRCTRWRSADHVDDADAIRAGHERMEADSISVEILPGAVPSTVVSDLMAQDRINVMNPLKLRASVAIMLRGKAAIAFA